MKKSRNKKDRRSRETKKKVSRESREERTRIATSYRGGSPPPQQQTLACGYLLSLTWHKFSKVQEDYRLQRNVIDKEEVAVSLQNQAKNRYKDVPCIDATRVILKGTDNDYIHANYVSTPKDPKRFICCQAPIKETIIDHWRMIVQEEVEVILMLCDYKVDGKEKCAEYVPTTAKPQLTFGPFTIKLLGTRKVEWQKRIYCDATVNISSLEVQQDGKVMLTVNHYHWIAMPERQPPPAIDYFPDPRQYKDKPRQPPIINTRPIELMKRLVTRDTKKPMVIHDSAGIGWTGFFVLTQVFLEVMAARKEFTSFDEHLSALRAQRFKAVETEAQYLYLHVMFVDYLQDASNLRVGAFIHEYDEYRSKLPPADKKEKTEER